MEGGKLVLFQFESQRLFFSTLVLLLLSPKSAINLIDDHIFVPRTSLVSTRRRMHPIFVPGTNLVLTRRRTHLICVPGIRLASTRWGTHLNVFWEQIWCRLNGGHT